MASIVSSTDFTANALADNGITVSRTPKTKVLLSSGTESLVDGTPENITAILSTKGAQYKNAKSGDVKEIDGYIMVAPATTIVKNDTITYSGTSYLIWDVVERGPSGDTSIYKYCPIILKG